jgi:hypothetical protein
VFVFQLLFIVVVGVVVLRGFVGARPNWRVGEETGEKTKLFWLNEFQIKMKMKTRHIDLIPHLTDACRAWGPGSTFSEVTCSFIEPVDRRGVSTKIKVISDLLQGYIEER